MKLVDDEDVETMIALYCGNWSDQNAPIQLFVELAVSVAPDIDVVGDDGYNSSDPCDQEVDSDSDLDMDEVPDYIDDEDVNDDRNITASSVGNQIRHTVIHNNPGLHMSLIDPDAAHVVEFSEYPEILLAH
ncbi:hypothetical protein GOBAR_AA20800 [Gossypium barbadense]|uniref:Uncharacterized protein n=1 Tax=Gossypium barbadense TaxID=3634 RepID=A0A2P5X953_GOSBA|nr:hypothetical protein GOBAR_AA20800 [Gossypium barbadense]